jgi:phosphotransferase system  glucose/maltose/N-acetylglucosamine-specific IIC component
MSELNYLIYILPVVSILCLELFVETFTLLLKSKLLQKKKKKKKEKRKGKKKEEACQTRSTIPNLMISSV